MTARPTTSVARDHHADEHDTHMWPPPIRCPATGCTNLALTRTGPDVLDARGHRRADGRALPREQPRDDEHQPEPQHGVLPPVEVRQQGVVEDPARRAEHGALGPGTPPRPVWSTGRPAPRRCPPSLSGRATAAPLGSAFRSGRRVSSMAGAPTWRLRQKDVWWRRDSGASASLTPRAPRHIARTGPILSARTSIAQRWSTASRPFVAARTAPRGASLAGSLTRQ
jgi:hypothetical protein